MPEGAAAAGCLRAHSLGHEISGDQEAVSALKEALDWKTSLKCFALGGKLHKSLNLLCGGGRVAMLEEICCGNHR